MAESVPTEVGAEEFARWLRPKDAIVALMERNGWTRDRSVRTLIARMHTALVVAAAEYVVWKPSSGDEARGTLRFVPPARWSPDSQWLPEDDFWETGDIDFNITGGSGYNIITKGRIFFFGVRIDPAGIDAIAAAPQRAEIDWNKLPALKTVIGAKQSAPSPALTVDPLPLGPDKRTNLSPAEAKKFCRLLLDGWPNTTEREAHKKAVAFFPDNKVPVKAFLDVFKSIRGPRNPGPRPKTGC